MICGNDQEVTWLHRGEQGRQAAVELLKSLAITPGVPAVAVDSIEIHKVGHHDTMVSALLHGGESFPPECGVSMSSDFPGNTCAGIDISDLANPCHRAARLANFLENGGGRRSHGKIAAVASSLETAGATADKRPSNDAADGQVALVEEATEAPTKLEESLKSKMILMASNLKNAVGGSIEDGLLGRYVLLPQLIDYLCS